VKKYGLVHVLKDEFVAKT